MKRLILSMAAALLLIAAAPLAHAADYFYSGVQCNSTSNDANYTWTYGVFNANVSSSIDVWCPFNGIQVGNGGITSVTANVYDRHSSDPVSCTLYVFTASGTQTYSGAQATSGAGWSLSSSTLTWSSITGSASYYGALKCTLPAYSQGYSYLTTFKVTTN